MGSSRRRVTEELVASRPTANERAANRAPVVLVLDDLRSAHNVGLVFRLADAAGVRALWLGGITAYPGSSERATRRIQKTGVGGSLDVVPWRHLADPSRGVAALRRRGWRVVVVEQAEGSRPWHRAALRGPTVIVMGHERAGVRDSLLRLAHEVVEVPVHGITNSLNVATCAAVLLFEMRRQRADLEVAP